MTSGRASPRTLHLRLAAFARARLRPTHPAAPAVRDAEEAGAEQRFLDEERRLAQAGAAKAPRDVEGFLRWFDALKEDGPGQGDPLFPWLEHRASLEQMRWFLRQEVAGEAGFDDLVALTQVRMPVRAKLELARNYWDEMGRGHASAMHGPLLGRLATALELVSDDEIVWESLALGNLMAGLALDRRFAWHSVGALGVVELTAPGRSAAVNRGLRRLGVAGQDRQYYALHATLDEQHYATWREEVLRPLVEEDPGRAPWLAEGALMRLNAGLRCFERYRRELSVG